MDRRVAGVVFVVLGILYAVCSPSKAAAGGFAIDEQGAAAMGRANAFSAQADDPSAIFYNPAGIGQLPGTQLSLGTTIIVPSYTFDSDVTGNSTDTESVVFFPPTLYATHEFRSDFHVGIGFYVPFGLSIEWPGDWEGRYLTTFSEINTLFINPTAAWSPSSRLHLAAGIIYVPSDVTLESKLEFVPGSDGDAKIEADGDGWGFSLGALAEIPGDNTVGLTFRSPVKIDYDGDADFTFPDPTFNFSDGIKSEITLPATVVLALANRSIENTVFELDIQWMGWSSVDEIRIKFDSGGPDAVSDKDWRNVYAFRLGVEHRNDDWAIRGGYAFDMSAVPSGTLDPSLPDANKHALAIGGGLDLTRIIRLDTAYMLIIFNDRDVGNVHDTAGTPFDQNGTYSAIVHELGISVTMAF